MTHHNFLPFNICELPWLFLEKVMKWFSIVLNSEISSPAREHSLPTLLSIARMKCVDRVTSNLVSEIVELCSNFKLVCCIHFYTNTLSIFSSSPSSCYELNSRLNMSLALGGNQSNDRKTEFQTVEKTTGNHFFSQSIHR